MSLARGLSMLVVGASLLGAGAASGADDRVYRDGLALDGTPVEGTRERLPSLAGADAACVRCHRRSGLGAAEGPYSMPPISAAFLASPREESRLSSTSEVAPGYHVGRGAFDDAELARAIREGVVPGGGVLNELMPRYALDEASMAALLASLHTLGAAAPGITDADVHFATIVTPDADPAAARAMLEVLEDYFAKPDPPFGAPRRMLHPNRNVGYRAVGRRWVLHVWTLSGAPATWEAQLAARLAAEPVFAVLSGIGGGDWAPVHHFCERAAVPCLLPNLDLPVEAEADFYPLYFSQGVRLEARLAARWFTDRPARDRPRRIVQVYRQGDIGVAAAPVLRRSLPGVEVFERALAADAGADAWRHAVAEAGPGDALMLWARAADLAALPVLPTRPSAILASGLMAGLTVSAVPPAWRERVRMTYPLDLPERRASREAMARGWLEQHGIPVVDERVQIDTYVACVATASVLGTIYETPSRELLVERFEDMLTTSVTPARYPSLSLAQGQRFASKGGYVVRFSSPDGATPVPEGDWIIP